MSSAPDRRTFGSDGPESPTTAVAASQSQTQAHAPQPRLVTLPRTWKRRVLFVLIYAAACGLAIVVPWWAFLSLRAGTFKTQVAAWEIFYPKLSLTKIKTQPASRDDDSFDVLLLGGSALDPAWGNIEAELLRRLVQRVGFQHRIVNLADSAHTSRDTLNKYRELSDSRFDLVVIYDGINDVRMNCCPPGTFQLNYSHCGWYATFDQLSKHGNMTLPPFADAMQNPSFRIPLGPPDDELLELGRDIRSPDAVEANHTELLTLAAQRNDPVIMLTFVTCIPLDYTRAKFDNLQLGYAAPTVPKTPCAAELWGRPDVVEKTVSQQNERVAAVAARFATATLLDVAATFPRKPELFIDVCHFSDDGGKRFVESIWPEIERHAIVFSGSHPRHSSASK